MRLLWPKMLPGQREIRAGSPHVASARRLTPSNVEAHHCRHPSLKPCHRQWVQIGWRPAGSRYCRPLARASLTQLILPPLLDFLAGLVVAFLVVAPFLVLPLVLPKVAWMRCRREKWGWGVAQGGAACQGTQPPLPGACKARGSPAFSAGYRIGAVRSGAAPQALPERQKQVRTRLAMVEDIFVGIWLTGDSDGLQ